MRDLSLHHEEWQSSQPTQIYSSEGNPAATLFPTSQPAAPVPPLATLPQGISPSAAYHGSSAAGLAAYSLGANYNPNWPYATHGHPLGLNDLAPSPGNFSNYPMAGQSSRFIPAPGYSHNIPPIPDMSSSYVAPGVSPWLMQEYTGPTNGPTPTVAPPDIPYYYNPFPVPPTPFVPPQPLGADIYPTHRHRGRRRRGASEAEENNVEPTSDRTHPSPHVRFSSQLTPTLPSPPPVYWDSLPGPMNNSYSLPQPVYPIMPPPYRLGPTMDAGEGWDEPTPTGAFRTGYSAYPGHQQVQISGAMQVSPQYPIYPQAAQSVPGNRSPYGPFPVSHVVAEPRTANFSTSISPSIPVTANGEIAHSPISALQVVNRRARRQMPRPAAVRAARRRADRAQVLLRRGHDISRARVNARLQDAQGSDVPVPLERQMADREVIEILSDEESDTSGWETAQSS